MIQRKLECVEVIGLKEPIHQLHAYGKTIFAITESQGIKVMLQNLVMICDAYSETSKQDDTHIYHKILL